MQATFSPLLGEKGERPVQIAGMTSIVRSDVPRSRPPRLARMAENRTVLGLLFLLPAAVFLLVFLTYPLGLGVWLGFTDTAIGRPGEFIGLENYQDLWTDSVFWLSVTNTIIYTVGAS